MITPPRNTPPKFCIVFGLCRKYFYTEYHADQFARALSLNHTPYEYIIL